ncbi:hypothetical protein AURDEDRAFT_169298 [Auricularia subglabra TFB-10046 SS5]|nr:hypothetical protein AURDEDRAFT_169298 [Auricularia subglabra TFB-10046 SS5]
MRVVRVQAEFKDAFERAVSEAKSAFCDCTVCIERFLERLRHIEVQLLADSVTLGNLVHLFEHAGEGCRDRAVASPLRGCAMRHAILSDALKHAKSVGYLNAGTAKFLVDQMGRHYFIEIHPRIPVEHTITGNHPAGATLPQLGLTQENVSKRGFAIQCRATTEDAAANLQPDTGKFAVHRNAGGNGVRLDANSGFAGA